MSLQHTSAIPRILVFDSGVGGLSIVREIQKKLPNVPLIYASDNAFFPYGTKGEAELVERVELVFRRLLAEYPVDMIVVACNTASTLALPHIRNHFKQPVVGVVPAIKPAAALSETKVIGLLATPATVARPYTRNLIRDYAPDCQVISVGSSELVQIAEQKLRGERVDAAHIRQILQPFYDHPLATELDVLVLACTHFPLLQDELAAQLPGRVRLIDSGEAIARRVVSLMHNEHLVNRPVQHMAVFTKASPAVDRLGPQLAQFGISNIALVEV